MKVDELKDILGWNRQFKTGTKDMLLARVIDGQMHGRLGRCPVCSQGQLQLKDENAEMVICKGYYDEDLSTRIPCDFEGPALDAPRLLPWYTDEPTEDEKADMDRIKEEVKAGRWSAKVAASPSTKNASKSLVDKAKALDWDLSSSDGLQKATSDLCGIVTEDGSLDVPEGEKKLRMAIGSTIVANRDMSAKDVMQAIIDKFGFAESKKAAAANKQAAMETVCKCPENATLMSLFHEMADLYFKDGNTFAGVSTRKAEKAIKDLPFVITAENALVRPGNGPRHCAEIILC
jgi:ssDNA-binding Zn-finger/Zn-ribbon topoisomerase 1